MLRSLLTAKKQDVARWNPGPFPGLVDPPSISRLPLEILAQIIHLVIENDDIQHLDLAIVCRKWRDAIYAHQRFWTTRRCTTSAIPGQRSTSLVAHLQRWFERAGTHPLTLKLTMTANLSSEERVSITEFLVQTTRWHSLHLQWVDNSGWGWLHSLFSAVLKKGPACWGMLQRLEIEARSVRLQSSVPSRLPFSTIAPNLRELKISFSRITNADCLIQSSFIPKKLQHLEITASISWEVDTWSRFWYHTLPQATNIEFLKVLEPQNYRRVDPNLQGLNQMAPSSPVSILTLTTLTAHDDWVTNKFLQHLNLPALTSLTFVSLNTSSSLHFASLDTEGFGATASVLPVVVERLIARSNCNIKHVSLENTPETSGEFVSLLRLLTTLETLELHPSSHGYPTWHLPSLLKVLSRNTGINELDRRGSPDVADPILPNLTSFYVRCGWNDWDIKEAFTNFVEHPRRWSTPHKSGSALEATGRGDSSNAVSPCARLENAQLFRSGSTPASLECYYARGRRAANYV